MKIKTMQWPIFSQILYASFFIHEENKIKCHDVGHMTKVVAMPIYVMNLSKYSPEPLDRFARNFIRSIYIKPIIVCINNAHGLTLTYLT